MMRKLLLMTLVLAVTIVLDSPCAGVCHAIHHAHQHHHHLSVTPVQVGPTTIIMGDSNELSARQDSTLPSARPSPTSMRC